MAKSTTEKPTKVKKTSKTTTSDMSVKKTKAASVVAVSESKSEASDTTVVTNLARASKKRKAAADDPALEVSAGEKSIAKAKKPRKAKVEGRHGEVEKAKAKGGREGNAQQVKNATESNSEIGEGHSEKGLSDEEDARVEAQENEEDVEFFGFSTDDADSSDEELDVDTEIIDVSKLPTIAKDDATVKRKLEKAKRKPTTDRGVIYLGRIPHGFYEEQMKAYFSQFGDVTRLRLSRSKKTGRSKHYAFIEFDSSAVAEIVAETMDNYLLMGHILRCKVIPKDEVHPELWIGANRKWRPVPNDRIVRLQHNKPRTEDDQEKAERRLLKRQAQKKRKLEEAGIKYNFDAVAYTRREQPTESK